MLEKYQCETLFVHEDKVNAIKKNQLDEHHLHRMSTLFKILGDPTRIKMLYALEQDELCVCDLAMILGMTQSAISHQLKTLKDIDLVRSRREGKSMFYRLADKHIHDIFKDALDHISERHDHNL